MTITANRIARGLLVFVFAVAALAKAYEFLTYGPAKGHWSALSSWSKGAMILVDALVVSLLLSRRWPLGCVAAIVVAAGGNLVYAAALVDGRLATLCGCLGRLVLTPKEHVILSMVLFLLAGWTIAEPRVSAGNCVRER
jgi:hypothetical protein